MKRIAMIVATLGGLLMLVTAMLAFDSFMTDDRKTQVRAEINSELDTSAARYEERRGIGCRRRCAGGLSHMIVTLRDGMFLRLPFSPDDALPYAPEGWTSEEYTLAAAETIFGREIRETMAPAEDNNKLLLRLNKAAETGASEAVQIYRSEDKLMAISIEVNRDAVRKAKDGEIRADQSAADIFVHVNGLPVRTYPQFSHDWRDGSDTPVDYQHFTMNIDQQVKIAIYALADQADVRALLNELDIIGIVDSLPHSPAGFDRNDVFALSDTPTASDT